MAKITRKSYKRKKTVMGITLFASIALISTGFAAWVVAKNASTDVDGNVKVGTVKDAAIGFTDIKKSADSFIFDCEKDDNSGRVYFQEDVNALGANLSITISGAITNPDYLKTLSIQMTVSDNVKNAAKEDKKYIVLPDCVNATQEITTFTDIASATEDEATKYGVATETKLKAFEYTITFKWGEAFNSLNPGNYFDEDPTGKEVAYEDVVTTMNDLYDTLNATSNTYKVILTATANV